MWIFAIVAAAGFLISESRAEGTALVQPAAIVDSAGNTPAAPVMPSDSLATAGALSTSAPVCTLDITTEPSGAVITLDGQKSGVTPLAIADVATGKHSVIIQKIGFYQKKVMLDITDEARVVLHFQLSAPGRLSIVSDPPGAHLTINGTERGSTPFIDSLVKPGSYRFSLRKDHYNAIDDSISVTGGGISLYKGLLTFAGKESGNALLPAATGRRWKKRNNLFIIGGAFVLFLVTLAAIESQE